MQLNILTVRGKGNKINKTVRVIVYQDGWCCNKSVFYLQTDATFNSDNITKTFPNRIQICSSKTNYSLIEWTLLGSGILVKFNFQMFQ